MPIDKYLIIRKAAELEEISYRMMMISDGNAAFLGNEKHVKNLRKTYDQLMGKYKVKEQLKAKKDPDWKERLMKYKR
ncbi:MAG: hypothetical protein RBR32_01635 [Bacteroidales bacterium]|nr:hypothetical protein [Bacteroidales bacterium]